MSRVFGDAARDPLLSLHHVQKRGKHQQRARNTRDLSTDRQVSEGLQRLLVREKERRVTDDRGLAAQRHRSAYPFHRGRDCPA